MTARRPSPAVQLARDVLHRTRCGDADCPTCLHLATRPVASDVTLARALLRATKERP